MHPIKPLLSSLHFRGALPSATVTPLPTDISDELRQGVIADFHERPTELPIKITPKTATHVANKFGNMSLFLAWTLSALPNREIPVFQAEFSDLAWAGSMGFKVNISDDYKIPKPDLIAAIEWATREHRITHPNSSRNPDEPFQPQQRFSKNPHRTHPPEEKIGNVLFLAWVLSTLNNEQIDRFAERFPNLALVPLIVRRADWKASETPITPAKLKEALRWAQNRLDALHLNIPGSSPEWQKQYINSSFHPEYKDNTSPNSDFENFKETAKTKLAEKFPAFNPDTLEFLLETPKGVPQINLAFLLNEIKLLQQTRETEAQEAFKNRPFFSKLRFWEKAPKPEPITVLNVYHQIERKGYLRKAPFSTAPTWDANRWHIVIGKLANPKTYGGKSTPPLLTLSLNGEINLLPVTQEPWLQTTTAFALRDKLSTFTIAENPTARSVWA